MYVTGNLIFRWGGTIFIFLPLTNLDASVGQNEISSFSPCFIQMWRNVYNLHISMKQGEND